MVWFELTILFFIVVVVSLFIVFRWLYGKRAREVEDIDMNAPIGINLVPELTRGHMILLEQPPIRRHISGALIIEAIPMDLRWREKDNKPELQPQIKKVKLALDKNQRISFATGEASSEREIVFYNVGDEKDLPIKLEKTSFGKILSTIAINTEVSNKISYARRIARTTEKNLLESIFGTTPNIYRKEMEETLKSARKNILLPQPKESAKQ